MAGLPRGAKKETSLSRKKNDIEGIGKGQNSMESDLSASDKRLAMKTVQISRWSIFVHMSNIIWIGRNIFYFIQNATFTLLN